MSGGHFDYNQYRIREIADSIERLIEKNGKKQSANAKKNKFGKFYKFRNENPSSKHVDTSHWVRGKNYPNWITHFLMDQDQTVSH